MRHLIWIIAAIAVSLLLILVVAGMTDLPMTLPLILFTGSMGATCNNYRRLIKIPPQTKNPLLESPYAVFQLYLSPAVGGIFAVMLFLLFVSQMITGSLFPNVSQEFSRYEGLRALIGSLIWAMNADFAKVLVWSFIAGFSETFVPNLLDQVAGGSNGENADMTTRAEPHAPGTGGSTV